MQMRKIKQGPIFFIQLVVTYCLVGGVYSQDQKNVDAMGFTGGSVTLACKDPTAPEIRWIDYVNNLSRDPLDIYTSATGLDKNHVKFAKYDVDRLTHALTIRDLQVSDTGHYVCESKVNASLKAVFESYIVFLVDKLICNDGVEDVPAVSVKEEVDVHCSVDFYGTIVSGVYWYEGEKKLNSEENFQLGTTISELRLEVEWTDDQKILTCKFSLEGGHSQQCNVKLHVKHLVERIEIDPISKMSAADDVTVTVGDKVYCRASGNPVPTFTGNTTLGGSAGIRSVEGALELTVLKDWVGMNNTFNCIAQNTLEGRSKMLSTSATFQVLALPTNMPLPVTEVSTKKSPPKAQQVNEERPPPTGALSTAGGDSSTGIAIGVVVGVIVIAIVVAAIVCSIRRKKQAAQKSEDAKLIHSSKTDESLHMEAGKRGEERYVEHLANHNASDKQAMNNSRRDQTAEADNDKNSRNLSGNTQSKPEGVSKVEQEPLIYNNDTKTIA